MLSRVRAAPTSAIVCALERMRAVASAAASIDLVITAQLSIDSGVSG